MRDASGAALGVTVAVVCDPLTTRAVWLAAYTELPAASVVVVPVCGSSLLGDDIMVDATRDSVLAAPPIELDVTFDPAQERVLPAASAITPSQRPTPRPTRPDVVQEIWP